MDGERGRGRDGPPGVASESGWEGKVGEDSAGRRAPRGLHSAAACRAPLCGDLGIELKPEDQRVGKDGGMQGKIVATSEAPKERPV